MGYYIGKNGEKISTTEYNERVLKPFVKAKAVPRVASGGDAGTGKTSVPKQPKLTATQADSIAGFENTKGAAQVALNLLALGTSSGPISGRTLAFKKLFGAQDENQLKLEQTLAKLKADFMKAISGAAVSESEATRLAKFLPSITDQENVIKTKLNTLISESDRTKKNLLGVIGGGTTSTGLPRNAILQSPTGQYFDSSDLSDDEYQQALNDGFRPK